MIKTPDQSTSLSNNTIQSFKSENTNLLSQIFTFDGKQITVLGTVDKPLFIGKEICDILGYKNHRDIMKKHVKNKWKIKYKTLTNNHPLIIESIKTIPFTFRADTDLIYESGLYALIFGSKIEKAELFRDKVFEEVLPSIRKTGEYKFKHQINTLECQLTLQNEQLQLKENALQKITTNHEKLLKKRSYYKFKKGPCFYVWKDPDSKVIKYKVGYTANINKRLSQERTSVPELKLVYLVYLPQAQLLEDMVLMKCRDYRVPQNHELVKITHEKIIKIVQNLLKYFKFNCTEETKLHKYNNEECDEDTEIDEVKLIFIDEQTHKYRVCLKCQERKELLSCFKKSGQGYRKTCDKCIKNPIIKSIEKPLYQFRISQHASL